MNSTWLLVFRSVVCPAIAITVVPEAVAAVRSAAFSDDDGVEWLVAVVANQLITTAAVADTRGSFVVTQRLLK